MIKDYLSLPTETVHSGLSPIDCIYVINLKERDQRWLRMKSVCKDAGLTINRFDAINGWKLSHQTISDLTRPTDKKHCSKNPCKTHVLSKGHIGCILSHVSIIQHAYQKGFQLLWTMEDDVKFLQDVHMIPTLISELNQLDPEWDILYTDQNWAGCWGHKLPVPVFRASLKRVLAEGLRPGQAPKETDYYLQRTVLGPFVRLHYRWGLHSYLTTRNGMKKILDYFNHHELYLPGDCDIHFIPDIHEYALEENMTGLISSKTSDTFFSPSPWKRFFRKTKRFLVGSSTDTRVPDSIL